MFKKDDLVKSPEYWMEKIQNELYFELKKYMSDNGINQTQLAEELGFSKGYISQILHGNFNHSYLKLVEISLAIGKEPDFKFKAKNEIQKGTFIATSHSKNNHLRIAWKNNNQVIKKDEFECFSTDNNDLNLTNDNNIAL